MRKLLLLFILLSSFIVKAQNPVNVATPYNFMKWVKVSDSLRIRGITRIAVPNYATTDTNTYKPLYYNVATGEIRKLSKSSGDTTSLSNRINAKQSYTDTNTYDATKYYTLKRINDTATTLRSSINSKQAKTDTTTYDATKYDVNKQRYSAGLLTAPTYTDNGNGTVTINANTVSLWNNSTFVGNPSTYSLSQATTNTTGTPSYLQVVDNSTNYIVVNYNSGTPRYEVIQNVDLITESDIVPVATIYRSGTSLHNLMWDAFGTGLANKLNQRMVKTHRIERESGLALSTQAGTGQNTGGYGDKIIIGSGKVWNGAHTQTLSADTSNGTSTTTYFCYQTGSLGTWSITISHTGFENVNYWNSGTIGLSELGSGKYTVNWIYRGVEDYKHIYIVMGEGGQYSTLEGAKAEASPSSLPSLVSSHALLVGRIISKQGTMTAQDVTSAFITVLTPGVVTDHNSLSGLQGGTSNEYYHLTSAQKTAVSDSIHLKANKSTTLTINSTTYDLSANRTWTIATAGSSAQVIYVADSAAKVGTQGRNLTGDGSYGKPYATLDYAKVMANNKGFVLIDVLSGSYTPAANLAYDSVFWKFEKNVTINSSSLRLFNYDAISWGGDIYILGDANFVISGSGSIFQSYNYASTINNCVFEFDKITANSSASLFNPERWNIRIKGNYINNSGSGNIFSGHTYNSVYANAYFDIGYIVNTNANSYVLTNGSNGGGNLYWNGNINATSRCFGNLYIRNGYLNGNFVMGSGALFTRFLTYASSVDIKGYVYQTGSINFEANGTLNIYGFFDGGGTVTFTAFAGSNTTVNIFGTIYRTNLVFTGTYFGNQGHTFNVYGYLDLTSGKTISTNYSVNTFGNIYRLNIANTNTGTINVYGDVYYDASIYGTVNMYGKIFYVNQNQSADQIILQANSKLSLNNNIIYTDPYFVDNSAFSIFQMNTGSKLYLKGCNITNSNASSTVGLIRVKGNSTVFSYGNSVIKNISASGYCFQVDNNITLTTKLYGNIFTNVGNLLTGSGSISNAITNNSGQLTIDANIE